MFRGLSELLVGRRSILRKRACTRIRADFEMLPLCFFHVIKRAMKDVNVEFSSECPCRQGLPCSAGKKVVSLMNCVGIPKKLSIEAAQSLFFELVA